MTDPNFSAHSLYLRDCTRLILEAAREARREKDAATEEDQVFQAGRLMAYYETVTLLIDQATSFGVALDFLGLADLSLEQELLG